MDHSEKCAHFASHAASMGLSKTSSQPAFIRLAWFLGWKLPPFQFLGFNHLVLGFGSPFGLFWGTSMWLILWRSSGSSPLLNLGVSIGAGLSFGVCMAWLMRRRIVELNLPAWEDYPIQPPPSANEGQSNGARSTARDR